MDSEYSLGYNRYVVDFCETTAKEDQSRMIDGIIHMACGLTINKWSNTYFKNTTKHIQV